MTPAEYTIKARSFLRHFDDPEQERAWIGTYIAEEAGELARELRPWIIGEPIDRERCIDEAGDLCWGLACHGFKLGDINRMFDDFCTAACLARLAHGWTVTGLIACVRDLCHVTLEEIMARNIAKLEARRGTAKDKQA